MSYSIDSTIWPEGTNVPLPVKGLVDRFFQTVDSTGVDSGDILAEQLFVKDGIAYFGSQPFRGADEIRKSRDHAWDAIKRRKHKVLRVYTRDADCGDLLFIAHVVMDLKNGRSVDGEFVGRLSIHGPGSQNPRLSLYQVWGDTSTLQAALREK